MTLSQNYETVSLAKVLYGFCESLIKSKRIKNKLKKHRTTRKKGEI